MCAENPTWDPWQGSVPACSPPEGWDRVWDTVPWDGLAPGDTWALASCEHKAKGSPHCRDFLWLITGLWNCREPKECRHPGTAAISCAPKREIGRAHV